MNKNEKVSLSRESEVSYVILLALSSIAILAIMTFIMFLISRSLVSLFSYPVF